MAKNYKYDALFKKIEKHFTQAAESYYSAASRQKLQVCADRDKDIALYAWIRNEVVSLTVSIKIFNPALESEVWDFTSENAKEYKRNISKLAYLIHIGTIFSDARCPYATRDQIIAAVERDCRIHLADAGNFYCPD